MLVSNLMDGTSRPVAPASLTPAEERVTAQLLTGQTTAQIAEALFVTEATVRTHLTHVYAKLGVRGRVELLASHAGNHGTYRPIAPIAAIAQPQPVERASFASVGASLLIVWISVVASAHLLPAAWPLVGPGLIGAHFLLDRWRNRRPMRLAMLGTGVLLCVEQLAVLVALGQL